MNSILNFLTSLGADYAFPAFLIIAVLFFLLKVLKPVFGQTAKIFAQYLEVVRNIKDKIDELPAIRKALEDIARNTYRGG